MSNYVTKAGSKGGKNVDKSHLKAKSILTRWKAEVDKKDWNKLKIHQANLSKLCNVVDNDVFQKFF